MTADAKTITEHIKGRIAKSGLDSPSVNITRDGWALIIDLLEASSSSEYTATVADLEALAAKNEAATTIDQKAQAEAELEDYCYQNLRKIIAGLRCAATKPPTF